MKAIRVHQYGGPEALKLDELPIPQPGPGQALVKIEAIGLNFIDVYHRTGLYPAPLPRPMGVEAAGLVEALGPDVTEVRVGDRVAYAHTGAPGAYAEYALVPSARLVSLPTGVDTRMAAAAMLQGMTAHYLTHSTYPLKKGDACLIHAAAGGVGLLLCQMARGAGARLFATVSTEEKARLAREAGAEVVIRYTEQDFETEVKRLTDGRGVQVVYDSVAKETFEKSLNCLAPRGLPGPLRAIERPRPSLRRKPAQRQRFPLSYPPDPRPLHAHARGATRARARRPESSFQGYPQAPDRGDIPPRGGGRGTPPARGKKNHGQSPPHPVDRRPTTVAVSGQLPAISGQLASLVDTTNP